MLAVVSCAAAYQTFRVYELNEEVESLSELASTLNDLLERRGSLLDRSYQLAEDSQAQARANLEDNRRLIREYERLLAILEDRGLADLVQEIRSQEELIDLQESTIGLQRELIDSQSETRALIEARLSEIRRRVLEIYATCTPDQKAALDQAQVWLLENESSVQAAMRTACETTPSLDCPDGLTSPGLFSDLGKAHAFCPSDDTLNAILLNDQGVMLGWALSQGYSEEFRWGAYAVSDEVFRRGSCQVAATAGHEFAGHLLLGQLHRLKDDGSVDQQDWIYRLGDEVQRLCLAGNH